MSRIGTLEAYPCAVAAGRMSDEHEARREPARVLGGAQHVLA